MTGTREKINVSVRPIQFGAAAAMVNILLFAGVDADAARTWLALSGSIFLIVTFMAASLLRLRAAVPIAMPLSGTNPLRQPFCQPAQAANNRRLRLYDAAASGCFAATSFLVVFHCAGSATPNGSTTVARNLPLAVHDEQSYLFQARTILGGRWAHDSNSESPAIFNQMHILNEGRQQYASRYFPGTGLWMAPFEGLRQRVAQSGRTEPGRRDSNQRLDILRLGHIIAHAIVSMVLYWIGQELSGRLCGFVSAILFAVSPGMGVFASLLLSHMPCLVGLSVFLLCQLRMMRTRWWGDALIGGCGLTFAMLCRPLTAAGLAFPFGIWMIVDSLRGGWRCPRVQHWVTRCTDRSSEALPNDAQGHSAVPPPNGGQSDWKDPVAISKCLPTPSRETVRAWWIWRNLRLPLWIAVPLLFGLGVQAWQNLAICGTPWKTPYQLYNDLYTPRHGYGFENGVRGDAVDAPKRLTIYDAWAKNLSLDMAVDNVITRWEASWRWTLGTIPLCIVLFIFLAVLRDLDRRWILLALSIVTLHVVYMPYWATGILGHSYVMETGIVWLMMTGVVTQQIVVRCAAARCWLAVPVWAALIVTSTAGNILVGSNDQPPRIVYGIEQIFRVSVEYEQLQQNLASANLPRPLLVLVHPEHPNVHFDFVNNDPTLDGDILFGRLSATDMSAAEIAALFPDRTCVLYDPLRRKLSESLTEMNSRSPD